MSSAGQQLIAGRIPGERIQTGVIDSDSSTFTVTPVQIGSVTAAVVAGRTYRVTADLGFETTADSGLRVRMHEDNTSGTVIAIRDIVAAAAVTLNALHIEGEYVADATENKTFVITGERESGTGTLNLNADANAQSYLYVDYISG